MENATLASEDVAGLRKSQNYGFDDFIQLEPF